METETTNKLQLSKINKSFLTIVLVTIAWCSYKSFNTSSNSSYAIGEACGRLFFFLMGPYFIAWVVWRIRGKSIKSANVAYFLTLGFFAFGQIQFISQAFGLGNRANIIHHMMDSDSKPWTHTIEKYKITLTLPNDHWVDVKKIKPELTHEAVFMDKVSKLKCFVEFESMKNMDEHHLKVTAFKEQMEADSKNSANSLKWSEGLTTSGYPYVYAETISKGDGDKEFYVLISKVYQKDLGLFVTFIFEGEQIMNSDMGTAALNDVFQKSSKSILMSIK